jgi:hypothetical protein
MRVRGNKNSTQRRRGHRVKRREHILRVMRGPLGPSNLTVSSLRLSLRSLRLCVENDSLQLRNAWH